MALYSIRSERQFCERPQYDLLFKRSWVSADDAFDATAFSHNRKRLLEHEVVESFLGASARAAKTLISEEHFTANGTLLQAWASINASGRRTKRSRHPPAAGIPPLTFTTSAGATKQTRRRRLRKRAWQRRAEARRRDTPSAATWLTENRNGLIVDAELCEANGTAERDTALRLIDRQKLRLRCTLGGDKAYDKRGFVDALNELESCRTSPQNAHGRKNGRLSSVPD